MVFRTLYLHPIPSQPQGPSLQPCTSLDSIFRGRIEIRLWGLPRDGDVLSDPGWFGGLEGWQEFALSSGAVGREDDCGVAEA